MVSKAGRLGHDEKMRSKLRIVFWRYSALLEISDLSAFEISDHSKEDEQAGSPPLRSFMTFFPEKCLEYFVRHVEKKVLIFENNFFSSFKAHTLAVNFIFIVLQRKQSTNRIFYRRSFKKIR